MDLCCCNKGEKEMIKCKTINPKIEFKFTGDKEDPICGGTYHDWYFEEAAFNEALYSFFDRGFFHFCESRPQLRIAGLWVNGLEIAHYERPPVSELKRNHARFLTEAAKTAPQLAERLKVWKDAGYGPIGDCSK
jgi:hypothetical protein